MLSFGCLAVAVALTATVLLAVPASATPIPAEPRHVISLDGTWRFKLEQSQQDYSAVTKQNWEAAHPSETPDSFERFWVTDYDDSDWHDIPVPGNWEMAGYSPATYNRPDNASGFYRKWVTIPADWKGRKVLVNFDGVQCGAEIWLNGQPVNVTEPSWGRANYHESGWTAWQADLTPCAKFGERNLLAIRVTKNTKSSDLDSGDYFFLGGVYRPATLFTVPQTHIQDVTVTTKLQGAGKAVVNVDVNVAGSGPASVAMSIDGLGEALSASPDDKGSVAFSQVVSRPKLWTAETPNLYNLTIELRDKAGKLTETITRRIGIREVTIKDGVLLVNGTRVKLTGMCRHDCYVPVGTAVGDDLWRKDLTLMKAANVNSVRTSHYPYGSGFYDLCDEMGFYVVDELPYCWCNTSDPALEPAYLQRARETVARDKNHPCVIIWAVGNENKAGDNLQAAADQVKALDTTRPRLVSWIRADRYGVEMDDLHYTNPGDIAKAGKDRARRAKWPIIYTENPNVWDLRFGADPGCLDLWAAILQRTWDVVWKYDGIPGSFLWEWQDRAVSDKCPTKLYEVDPGTGIQYLKTKGVVDGLRNPRPEYYHVKMVYSPIKVEPRIDLKSAPGAAILSVTNRYSFTDLGKLKAKWILMNGGTKVKSGTAKLALAPLTSGKVKLPLPSIEADTLRIDFDDPRGWNVVSYQFPLTNKKPTAPKMTLGLPGGIGFPELNLVKNDTVNDPVKWRKITRYHARTVNAKADERSIDADIVLGDDPTVVGHVHAQLDGGRFTYRIDWTGEKADIQELGWRFDMPASCDRFSWNRQAPWSVYPDKHIGRPSGTARPDSAKVNITDWNRPDAFDFVSTKYNCNWATLADAKGQGLMVEFAANDRHHVRGGIGPNGTYELIVNKQCSPPRYISSPIVKDFYLTLEPGDSVEGSFRVGPIATR